MKYTLLVPVVLVLHCTFVSATVEEDSREIPEVVEEEVALEVLEE